MADDLHARYMAATRTWHKHAGACGHCTKEVGPRCSAGSRLYESFARLQDAYLGRQRRAR
ncbi:hypothetical protein OG897_40040 [Streptomyces sp. NBC_00237]|uniref:hypothetical protein n=1 Tax=Streptomyces sp. NBC_00237 TaxID=2975687 RepID=UPI0022514398|nr:hypothetical protein [Streptomyces sp. NBC_00237]MCX5207583.1 hypothetical protein [Streptomyces sp. NBC_00237]